MSNWSYVAIAYTTAWGALAVYALLLARRVVQANEVAGRLKGIVESDRTPEAETECDAPPAP